MRPKSHVLIGILLICVALLFFIYMLEQKTIVPGLLAEPVYFNIIKYAGYLIAIFGIIFLFGALIAISRMKTDFEALKQWRAANPVRPDADAESTIKIVRFVCLNCGKRITAEFNKKKDSVKCPHCQVANLIPDAAIESAEEVILKRQKFPLTALPNSSRPGNGFSISFMKLLAWINLIFLFAIGIYSLVQGFPNPANAKIYLGIGLMYAGLNLATVFFVLSDLAFNVAGKVPEKREAV